MSDTDALKRKIEDLRAELNDYEDAEVVLTEENEKLRSQLEKVQKESQLQLKTLAEQLEALRTKQSTTSQSPLIGFGDDSSPRIRELETALRREKAAVEAEVRTGRSTLAQREAEWAKTLKAKDNEVAQLKQQLAEKEKEFETEMASFSATLKEMTSKVEHTQRDLERKEDYDSDTDRIDRNASRRLAEQETLLHTRETQIAELQRQLADVESHLAVSPRHNQKQQQQLVAELTARLEAVQANETRLHRDVNTLKRQLESGTGESKLAATVEALTSENRLVGTQLEAAVKRAQDAERRVTVLTQERNQLNRAKESIEGELETIRKKYLKLLDDSALMQREHQQLAESKQKAEQESGKRLGEFAERITQLTTELSDARLAFATQRIAEPAAPVNGDMVNYLRAELTRTKQDLANLRGETPRTDEELREELQRTRDALAAMQKELIETKFKLAETAYSVAAARTTPQKKPISTSAAAAAVPEKKDEKKKGR